MEGYKRHPQEVMDYLSCGRTTAFNLTKVIDGVAKLASVKVAGKRYVADKELQDFGEREITDNQLAEILTAMVIVGGVDDE